MKNLYQQKKKKTNCVLMLEKEAIATFGNLRKLVEYVKVNELINFDKNVKLTSYWTLIRKKNNPISFGKYSIFRVKHY